MPLGVILNCIELIDITIISFICILTQNTAEIYLSGQKVVALPFFIDAVLYNSCMMLNEVAVLQ